MFVAKRLTTSNTRSLFQGNDNFTEMRDLVFIET